jgi:DNA-binding GntR family transcriptional regulator
MVKQSSKSDALYARMRTDILSLGLAPGIALRLPALSERYDFGMTPLRECLNRLSAEKLVVIEHNKGFRVASLSLDDLLDLERSRNSIEGALFERSIIIGDDNWEAGVIGVYHQLSDMPAMSVLGTPDELDRWNTRHAAFHNALVNASDSPWMKHFREQLNDQLGRYQLFIQNSLRELSTSHPSVASSAATVYSRAMAFEPHTALYKVVINRDVAAARKTFEAHVGLSIRAFVELSAMMPPNTEVAETLGQTNSED